MPMVAREALHLILQSIQILHRQLQVRQHFAREQIQHSAQEVDMQVIFGQQEQLRQHSMLQQEELTA